MKEDHETFTGEEFLNKLQNDEVISQIAFEGMVKKSKDDPKVIMFAHGTNCNGWVAIPAAQLEKVEVLSVVPCKEHSHPYVRIHLKRPTTDEGSLFSQLALTAQPQQSTIRRVTPTQSAPKPFNHEPTYAENFYSPRPVRPASRCYHNTSDCSHCMECDDSGCWCSYCCIGAAGPVQNSNPGRRVRPRSLNMVGGPACVYDYCFDHVRYCVTDEGVDWAAGSC
jgi:hypothetical protein